MEPCPMEVQMLGGFVLRRGEVSAEVPARARKVYLLLAYLLRERDRAVPLEELAALLWPGEAQGPARMNSLKALLHRARNILDGAGAGGALVNREGCLRWSADFPVRVDAEAFVSLCRAGDEDAAGRVKCWAGAAALYRGTYLPAAWEESWAAGQARELHALWLEKLLAVLPLLGEEGRWEEAAGLAAHGLELEPCREDLCRRQMDALEHLGRRREAVEVYEQFQARLLERTGALPSDGLRELCRAASNGAEGPAISPASFPDRLREPPAEGALLCGFDFFRVICFSLTRMAQRSGTDLFAALFTLSGSGGGALPRFSLNRAMDNLQGVLLGMLRRGDVVARCSASQFALLLPQARYEDARRVCTRARRAFSRQFPHAPVELDFCVVPLTGDRPAA